MVWVAPLKTFLHLLERLLRAPLLIHERKRSDEPWKPMCWLRVYV